MERVYSVLPFMVVGFLSLIVPLRSSIHGGDDVCTMMEGRALVSIKNWLTSADDYLAHWNSTTNHCRWPEISCDESNFVIAIYITKNYTQLGGRLADLTEGLANLTRLKYLIISDTKISGEIPIELGNFTSLKELDLSSNNLIGSIPDELGNLLNIEYLFLSRNGLSGIIPSSLGNLINLTALSLSENNFTCAIPPSLGNLMNLAYMSLRNNGLSGEIPITLTNISSLEYLDLSNNDLGGKIPCNGSFVKFGLNSFENNPRLNTTCKPTSVSHNIVHSSCDTDPVCAYFRLSA